MMKRVFGKRAIKTSTREPGDEASYQTQPSIRSNMSVTTTQDALDFSEAMQAHQATAMGPPPRPSTANQDLTGGHSAPDPSDPTPNLTVSSTAVVIDSPELNCDAEAVHGASPGASLDEESGDESDSSDVSSAIEEAAPQAAELNASCGPFGALANNGGPPRQTNGHANGEEDEDLTPPPENMSPASSVNNNALEGDEIVVGANTNGVTKSSPLRVTSDQEEEEMGDAESDQPVVSHYPKRKRASVYNDLSEDKIENSMIGEEVEGSRVASTPKKRHGIASVKGAILGYWRDSKVPDDEGKHSVIGFIDVRDRLRTRIQTTDRSDRPISAEYPLPPGPGGSWVTFNRMIFDDHLIGLDHYQIKEYVKIRSDSPREANEQARKVSDLAAVKEAKRRCQANPAPENARQDIAYGRDIPQHAMAPTQPEPKRRRHGGGIGTISAGPIASAPAPELQEPATTLDPLLGTRPTKILLGYWRGSSEPDPKDRHAVYGILGMNDMFRVKVVRETRDGRFVDGNFPTGAGALWIHYEEVELEQHLKHLQRNEIKEYCRVRQSQLDHGEKAEDRLANETVAVYEAAQRVAQGASRANFGTQQFAVVSPEEEAMMEQVPQGPEPRVESSSHELRHTRRAESRTPRYSLPDVEMRQASRVQSTEALERTNSIARREVAKLEAAQQRNERYAANREAYAVAAANATNNTGSPGLAPPAPTNGAGAAKGNGVMPTGSRLHEMDEVQRMNRVWARQEEQRLKAGVEDAKIYAGIKYERKTNGPFHGKLVSQGKIISIEGEDYVEYRVLTKPSFF
jgi:hypothetical protein